MRLVAYQDVAGRWTIGYGHTGPEVCPGLTWTQGRAAEALAADIRNAVNCVNHAVTFQLTQSEFDALVDFVYNLGCHAFISSRLLTNINTGDLVTAATQFDLWDHAGGKVVAGLLRRRQDETREFQGSEG